MYINELRCKKRDESLVCKICKNKPFTAAATLLYHYRSHAGECIVVSASFYLLFYDNGIIRLVFS